MKFQLFPVRFAAHRQYLPCLLAFVALTHLAPAQTPTNPGTDPTQTNVTTQPSPPPPLLNWQVTAKDWNSARHEAAEPVLDPVTGQTTNLLHHFVKWTQSGSYLDESGAWQTSQDLVELTSDGGAAATHCPNKVYFKPSLVGTDAPITIVSASNQVFKTGPIGLYFHDPVNGSNFCLSTIRDCIAELHPPNTLVWTSALTSIKAQFRVIAAHDGAAADLILLEKPRPPSAYGFSDKTYLEVWHACSSTIGPRASEVVLARETNSELRAAMQEPDFVSELLDIGEIWFPMGAAFSWSTASDAPPGTAAKVQIAQPGRDTNQVYVAKRWISSINGSIMIESVRWSDISQKLADLPEVAALSKPSTDRIFAHHRLESPVVQN